MKVVMFWHGGINYSVFDTSCKRDAEQFDSLKDAKAEFINRAHGFDSYRPCVEDSSAWIMVGTVDEALGRDYPDYVITETETSCKVERA
jgi:hypothetical protein